MNAENPAQTGLSGVSATRSKDTRLAEHVNVGRNLGSGIPKLANEATQEKPRPDGNPADTSKPPHPHHRSGL